MTATHTAGQGGGIALLAAGALLVSHGGLAAADHRGFTWGIARAIAQGRGRGPATPKPIVVAIARAVGAALALGGLALLILGLITVARGRGGLLTHSTALQQPLQGLVYCAISALNLIKFWRPHGVLWAPWRGGNRAACVGLTLGTVLLPTTLLLGFGTLATLALAGGAISALPLYLDPRTAPTDAIASIPTPTGAA